MFSSEVTSDTYKSRDANPHRTTLSARNRSLKEESPILTVELQGGLFAEACELRCDAEPLSIIDRALSIIFIRDAPVKI